MPSGIPGQVNRVWACIIEAQVITPYGSTGAPGAYGLPLVIDATSGQARTLAVADTAVYGILVRPFPTGNSQDPLGTSTPPALGACDVLVSGYIMVLLGGTTAATKSGAVYVWTAATSAPHTQGTFEAAANGGNTILVANAYFTGAADSAGNTEIAFRV